MLLSLLRGRYVGSLVQQARIDLPMPETFFVSDLHLEAKRRPMTDLFLRFLRERTAMRAPWLQNPLVGGAEERHKAF